MNLSKDSPSGQGSGAGRAESVWSRRHGSVDGLRPWGLLLGHRALMHLVHWKFQKYQDEADSVWVFEQRCHWSPRAVTRSPASRANRFIRLVRLQAFLKTFCHRVQQNHYYSLQS